MRRPHPHRHPAARPWGRQPWAVGAPSGAESGAASLRSAGSDAAAEGAAPATDARGLDGQAWLLLEYCDKGCLQARATSAATLSANARICLASRVQGA